ncbi:hypothetical protein A2303_05125 [Candidatus Falkowbacteria bacterium RIFOXYB2_FULL_47_14]|uniref:Phosphoribosyltransferase domain-containing protein n=1 Tax=Candidatus Falkowbacteria bacterium RIFOXYA2_FULL_47_19 TaxID=1797994 RepID=A0A1F5SJ58_9BACT|nr:MAG: hypothetical protein A2227_06505 [Candidatus Falkowbacteria bacterium RIFOXYA2_FULL_47_19]OGF35740.1 MAG: hypothetical protein A2468_05180 [Candidatus Falkowbacteria bacterium RIFOXYC2_FULL_46_15]OGF43299.1 MAG: hypothetical protein A2303_05125 [Candidatus Falkowbacteria bacterium RIFOXYB2_FULL_47_14]
MKDIKSNIKNLLSDNRVLKTRDFILDLIFPIECLSCGHEGAWLCGRCFSRLNFKEGQYCLGCKRPDRYGRFCSGCAPDYRLEGVWIAGDYENKILAKMIKSLKYHFARDLADILGLYLSLFLRDLLTRSRLSGIHLGPGLDKRGLDRLKDVPGAILDLSRTTIMPVPLHKKRERWRGFNQAFFLARSLADKFGLDVRGGLVRVRHKKPQAKLTGIERLANIRDCFAWTGDLLEGRNVILIDDVVTTGSTLNECARVLKDAGAGEVWGLVAAKG